MSHLLSPAKHVATNHEGVPSTWWRKGCPWCNWRCELVELACARDTLSLLLVPIGASFLFIANIMFSPPWSTMSLILKIGSVCALNFQLAMLLVAFLCIFSFFYITCFRITPNTNFVIRGVKCFGEVNENRWPMFLVANIFEDMINKV